MKLSPAQLVAFEAACRGPVLYVSGGYVEAHDGVTLYSDGSALGIGTLRALVKRGVLRPCELRGRIVGRRVVSAFELVPEAESSSKASP